jgi:oligosaccharyl transferase (archaeosortase A-associated)
MSIPLNKNFNIVPEDNFNQIVLLVILAAIMFFIRTVPIYQLVFTNWPGEYGGFVNFSADDAVYHMRFVHNTLHHYPWRVFFDPFTHFPFGDRIHFGPLFTLIIATASLIVGLGRPTPELINFVGAYTPVIIGILCLIPVYFITRKLFGKTAAIISAFILAFLPGEFLQRSALGFTDHHIAETLFSTVTCAFLIYALDIAKKAPTAYRNILNYGFLTGIAFGLFVLVWPAALMFGVIFLIFFIIQLTINHIKGEKTEYLLLLATVVYSIPVIMVLPYALIQPHLQLTGYSLAQPLILIIMATTLAICYVIYLLCKRNQLAKDLYSIILAAIFFLIGFTIYCLAPKLFAVMQDGCNLLFNPAPGMKTISEVHPSILDQNGDKYTIVKLWQTYFWVMLFSIIGFGYLCYRAYKNINPIEILLLTWTIAVILAAIFQCRFNYYLAINAAILTGCYCIYPIINFFGNLRPKRRSFIRLQKIVIYAIFCVLMFVIADPIWMLIMDKNIPLGLNIARERYDTFMWLKHHTPNPQGKFINKNFDYAAGLYPIPKNPDIPYKHKDSAYGIMSWWDVGHQLTYIAERIPNANPFQSGIIEKNKFLGAAPFFTSTSEEKAIANLNAMGSRYVFI